MMFYLDCDIDPKERVLDTGKTTNMDCLSANFCFGKDQGKNSKCYRKKSMFINFIPMLNLRVWHLFYFPLLISIFSHPE